jgi:hypothetical protein
MGPVVLEEQSLDKCGKNLVCRVEGVLKGGWKAEAGSSKGHVIILNL